MFQATDTPHAPWHVAVSDDKERARLNIITHLLSQVPYASIPREEIILPPRQEPGDYVDPGYTFRYVPEEF